jgi:hypothetical protein
MKESFLHYIWRTRQFSQQQLFTTTQLPIEILDPGEFNTNSGPDFFNARLRIGETVWAGNVEVHLKASDWLHHGHQHDPAYDSVVLHVVYVEDKILYAPGGQQVACLEMRGRIPQQLVDRYVRLEQAKGWVPCADRIGGVDPIVLRQLTDRMMVERLEEKTADVFQRLQRCNNDWETVFYQSLAGCFGLKVNEVPFLALACALPHTLLVRHREHPYQVEALIFGQAGFLAGTFSDAYPQNLADEYRHLSRKYQLAALSAWSWKFSRMRPPAFPTVRLALFAALWKRGDRLFSKVLETASVQQALEIFDVVADPYWDNRFRFDRSARLSYPKQLGFAFRLVLVLNVVVPILYSYGKSKGEDSYCRLALKLLEELPPEENSVLKSWRRVGLRADQGGVAQALLHLKARYCDERRCLECVVGNALLR